MMIKFIGISLCVLFCSVILREYNKQFAVIINIVAALLLAFAVSKELFEIVDEVKSFSLVSDTAAAYCKLMIKILGITLITQIVCDICRDNGENSLASITSAAAKIVIISLILPLFKTVISIVGGLLRH